MLRSILVLSAIGAPAVTGFAAEGGVFRAAVLRGRSSAEGLSPPAPRMQAGGSERLVARTLSAVEIHDRQWELNKLNFAAQWECDMKWYQRSSDATTTKQVPFSLVNKCSPSTQTCKQRLPLVLTL